jgi:F-type H+-transporting ATPase subunit epsilon
MEGSGKSLQCVVVTPARPVLDERTDFVSVPLYDGELGVLPGRLPLVGRLGPGELRLGLGGSAKRYFIDGGFVQIRDNVVTLLTPRAMRADEISPVAAARALQTALAPAATPEGQDAQLLAQARARAQLRLAQHSQGEKHS